jgi:hypothetical protein
MIIDIQTFCNVENSMKILEFLKITAICTRPPNFGSFWQSCFREEDF